MLGSIQEVVTNCEDPRKLAAFWGSLLDATWAVDGSEWAIVAEAPVFLAFRRAPSERRYPRSNLHLDVVVDDLEGMVQRAVELGGSVLREPVSEGDGGFAVLADPEGNRFCLVVDCGNRWSDRQRSLLSRAARPSGCPSARARSAAPEQ